MRRFTHLARSVRLRYPNHRWMLGIVALAAISGWLWPGERGQLMAAGQTALAAFLGWAISQELDPDHSDRALLISAGVALTAVITGAVSGTALALVMVTARIVTRSTGRKPLLTDVVALGVFAGVFARTPIAWAAGMGLAVGLALDAMLPDPAPRRSLWLASAVAIAVTVAAVMAGAFETDWDSPSILTWASVGAGLAATALAPVHVRSTNDRRQPLDPTRMRFAWWLAMAVTTVGAGLGGAAGEAETWPLLVAVAGTACLSRLPSSNG